MTSGAATSWSGRTRSRCHRLEAGSQWLPAARRGPFALQLLLYLDARPGHRVAGIPPGGPASGTACATGCWHRVAPDPGPALPGGRARRPGTPARPLVRRGWPGWARSRPARTTDFGEGHVPAGRAADPTPSGGAPMTTVVEAPSPIRARSATDSGVLAPLVAVSVCLLPLLVPAGPGTAPLATSASAPASRWQRLAGQDALRSLSLPAGRHRAGDRRRDRRGRRRGPVGTLPCSRRTSFFLWGVTRSGGTTRGSSGRPRRLGAAWPPSTPAWPSGRTSSVTLFSGSPPGRRPAFGDPNLAANYLVTSLFVMAARCAEVHTAARWSRCGHGGDRVHRVQRRF